MTVPQPTPPKKLRIGCGSASESAWCHAWALPLTGQLLGLDSTAPPAMGVTWSSKYIERTRGVSKIARRRWNHWCASCRLPYATPRGRSCYVGQVTPRAKSGSSRICAQRASVKWRRGVDHHSNNTSLNRLSLGTRLDTPSRNIQLLNSSDFSETPGIKDHSFNPKCCRTCRILCNWNVGECEYLKEGCHLFDT